MPLIFEKNFGAAKKLSVWEINEPLSFFLEKLGRADTGAWSEKRKLEQACSEYLLDLHLGPGTHQMLRKDAFGKPYLEDSLTGISFSHSGPMVACLSDESGAPAGVDIEKIRPNIAALAAKFMDPADDTGLSGDLHCQVIWGAKEALYKIYGKKGLDFARDLRISTGQGLEGNIHKNEFRQTYPLAYRKLKNFILVWNL